MPVWLASCHDNFILKDLYILHLACNIASTAVTYTNHYHAHRKSDATIPPPMPSLVCDELAVCFRSNRMVRLGSVYRHRCHILHIATCILRVLLPILLHWQPQRPSCNADYYTCHQIVVSVVMAVWWTLPSPPGDSASRSVLASLQGPSYMLTLHPV